MTDVNFEKLRSESPPVVVSKPATDKGPSMLAKKSYSSPWRLFYITAGSIFFAELFIMLIITDMPTREK
jgi:hypothetical protein